MSIPNTAPRIAPVHMLLRWEPYPETAGRRHIPHMVPHTTPHAALPPIFCTVSHRRAGRVVGTRGRCMSTETMILKSTPETAPQTAPRSTEASQDGRARAAEDEGGMARQDTGVG